MFRRLLFRLAFNSLRKRGMVYWYCGRCHKWPIPDDDKKCDCKKGPSPYHLCITP